MPAATIVAAWIRADTGDGPSIASGSHTCRGSCADLPTAPQKRSSGIARLYGTVPDEACAARSLKLTVPRRW